MSRASIQESLREFKVSDAVVVLCFISLVIGDALQARLLPQFAYIDEGITVILAIWALPFMFRGSKVRFRFQLLCTLMLFLAVGLISTVISGVEQPYTAVLIDLFTCAKFFLVFIASTSLFEFGCASVGALRAAACFSRVYLVLLVISFAVNCVVDLGMTTGEREAFSFFYGHPSNFAAAVVGCLGVILADGRNVRFYTFLAVVLFVASNRFKAMGFAFVIFIAVFFYGERKKIPRSFLVLALFGLIFIAQDQIRVYFLDTDTARSALLLNAFKVAAMFIPFGSGFATYGSSVTISHYSPLYYTLGFHQIWGLSPLQPSYIADSFWPIILGQFGLIGLILFVCLFFILIKEIKNLMGVGGISLWSVCSIVGYLLIASTSETAFFSSYAPCLALSLALALSPALSRCLRGGRYISPESTNEDHGDAVAE